MKESSETPGPDLTTREGEGTPRPASHAREVTLASQSPRRLEILKEHGFTVDVARSTFDEATLPRDQLPERFAAAAARGKALGVSSTRPVVAADTIVVVDGVILGKPADAADARRMLSLLSGRPHEVLTAAALRHQGQLLEIIDRSVVTFCALTPEQISDYLRTGEPYDKAGAYAIQGAAGQYISSYSGSYWNIVGFPIEKFLELWERLFPTSRAGAAAVRD